MSMTSYTAFGSKNVPQALDKNQHIKQKCWKFYNKTESSQTSQCILQAAQLRTRTCHGHDFLLHFPELLITPCTLPATTATTGVSRGAAAGGG